MEGCWESLAPVAAPLKFVYEKLERDVGCGAFRSQAGGAGGRGGGADTPVVVFSFHARKIVGEGGACLRGIHLALKGGKVSIDEGDELEGEGSC